MSSVLDKESMAFKMTCQFDGRGTCHVRHEKYSALTQAC